MKTKWLTSVITVVATLQSPAGWAGPYKLEQVREVLTAAGEAVSDFQYCNGNWKSLSASVREFTKRCAINTDERFRMNQFVEVVQDNRDDAITKQGATCKGNLDTRLSLLVSTLENAAADCGN